MKAAHRRERSSRFRSISHRFSYALIGVITLILIAFAVIAMMINAARITQVLETKLSSYLSIAKVSLITPLWNLDYEAVNGFIESLFIDESVVYVQLSLDDEVITGKARDEFQGRDVAYFARSSQFIAAAVDIVHEGEIIGTLRLAISRASLRQELLLNIAGTVALLVLVIAAIAVISFIISRRYIARPLAQLQQSAELIADGELNVIIDTRRSDEIGALAASFNQMAADLKQLIDKIRRKNIAFERFVPVKFLRHLGKDEVEDVRLGDVSREELSVLFSDIRAFTSLSETMTPEENFRFLNTYLAYIGPVIERNDGFIDKYVGDAIMALFSGDKGNAADSAVRAAVAILEQLSAYNAKLGKIGREPIAAGIGIHTGPLMLGTIGFAERMDGTVIGDTVNLASRVESLTKHYGITIAITSTTLQCLYDLSAFLIREIDTVRVRGRQGVVTLYEVFNGDAERTKEKKYRILGRYHEAIELYKTRRWCEALQLLEEIRPEMDRDRLLALYVQRCRLFLDHPPDASWSGITILDESFFNEKLKG